MLFNSLEFPLFMGVLLLLFYLLKGSGQRRILLLLASLFFYGYWKWTYLLLLIASSGIDFFAALGIGNTVFENRKKAYLFMSLSANLGILAFFKYSAFLGKAFFFFEPGEVPDWVPLVLPVGISFYTFQAMSYVLDVYRGRMKAEVSWTNYMLFITFFPQLVAGPIERAPHLLEQVKNPFLNRDILPGITMILSGFFKKLLIADRLGVYVDAVFNQPDAASVPQLLLGTFFFGFQIYGDFSGYSDIARGCASFFGIELMANFRSPYFSKDLGEFWRRWHISLSGWFRDYLYQPLGGSSQGRLRGSLNLMLVFCLSGLWHGANWTFLIWGCWHGFGLVLQRSLGPILKPSQWLTRLLCLFWVFAGWFFFRVNSAQEALVLINKIGDINHWNSKGLNLFYSSSELSLSLLAIGILLFSETLPLTEWTRKIRAFSIEKQVGFGLLALSILLWFGQFKGGDFIYFQF